MWILCVRRRTSLMDSSRPWNIAVSAGESMYVQLKRYTSSHSLVYLSRGRSETVTG